MSDALASVTVLQQELYFDVHSLVLTHEASCAECRDDSWGR